MRAHLLLTFLVLASGCVANPDGTVQQADAGTEYIGGRYNLTLLIQEAVHGDSVSTTKKIQYVMDGEVIDPDQALPDSMRPGLDWLRENTPEGSVVMSWWDYGHAIRAYSEREPVVDSPSREILVTTVSKHLGKSPDEVECDSCVSHDVIQDVASLLLSGNDGSAADLMREYGADYLYVHVDDRDKAPAFYVALGREEEPITSTLLGRALEFDPLEGFVPSYEDDVSRIYELAR